jgi:hypothetical protein
MMSSRLVAILCHIPTSIEAEDQRGRGTSADVLMSAHAEETGVSCRALFRLLYATPQIPAE